MKFRKRCDTRTPQRNFFVRTFRPSRQISRCRTATGTPQLECKWLALRLSLVIAAFDSQRIWGTWQPGSHSLLTSDAYTWHHRWRMSLCPGPAVALNQLQLTNACSAGKQTLGSGNITGWQPFFARWIHVYDITGGKYEPIICSWYAYVSVRQRTRPRSKSKICRFTHTDKQPNHDRNVHTGRGFPYQQTLQVYKKNSIRLMQQRNKNLVVMPLHQEKLLEVYKYITGTGIKHSATQLL